MKPNHKEKHSQMIPKCPVCGKDEFLVDGSCFICLVHNDLDIAFSDEEANKSEKVIYSDDDIKVTLSENGKHAVAEFRAPLKTISISGSVSPGKANEAKITKEIL